MRLDPDNIQFEDSDLEASGDDISACPPTSSNKVTRERVLSDEGKKLFLNGHDPRGNPNETGAPVSRRTTADGRYNSEYDDDDSDGHSQDNGYVPPMAAWQQPRNGHGYPGNQRYMQSTSSISDGASTRDGHEDGPSGFSFMTSSAPENDEVVKSSAFGFISSTDGDDDASSQTSLTDRPSGNSSTGFEFMNKGASQRSSPKMPSIQAEEFLNANPSLDQNEFADLWDSTNESCVGESISTCGRAATGIIMY